MEESAAVKVLPPCGGFTYIVAAAAVSATRARAQITMLASLVEVA